jgi:hypothetical protein
VTERKEIEELLSLFDQPEFLYHGE